jgi:hypothetical protein
MVGQLDEWLRCRNNRLVGQVLSAVLQAPWLRMTLQRDAFLVLSQHQSLFSQARQLVIIKL